MLKIKPCMCKYKVQEGWNCERLIRTVIVSSISKYKDSFVNDKDNTWDDLGCRDTFRPLHQLSGVKRKDIQSESGYHDNCRIAIFNK